MTIYYPATALVESMRLASGSALSGGTLSAFLAGTSTATNMFTDKSGTSAGSVLTLNSRGEPEVSGAAVVIWLDDTLEYKFVLKDSSGATIWTVDNYSRGLGDILREVDTVSAMKAAPLSSGLAVRTRGYYAPGDGGGAEYLIKTAAAYGATPDEYGDHTLANGNIAVLQVEGTANIKQFGAKADGATDDTNSLEAALTAEKRVFVPTGTYILDNVSLPSDAEIIASRNAVFKLSSSSATKVLFNGDVNTNIYIEGGQFNNNEVVNSVAIQFAGTGLKAFRCHHLGGTGAQMFFSLNGSASQVEIAYCTGNASRFFVLTGGTTSATSDVWVHHCYASNVTGDFVEINCPSGTARRWNVSHNIVDTCGRDNVGTGFGVGASGGTGYIDGLTIAFNHFRDVDNQSIHIEDGAKNVDIIGNQIYGNGANSTASITNPCGIYVAATAASNRQISNVTIRGNKIIGLGDMNRGIFCGGSYDITNIIVDGNTIDAFDDYGIYMSSLIKQGQVINNSSRKGTGSASGIRVDGTNVQVGFNRFSDNAGYGIDVIAGTNIQFIKNQMKNNTSGRINGMNNGASMDWSLQSEAVTSNRTITGTQNNIDPLDEEVITVTSASSVPQITGVLAKPNGELYIVNATGSVTFDLMHENTSSTDVNRFITTSGADITLAVGKVAHFKYINTRWRQLQ